MEVLCFRFLIKNIDKILMHVHFPFNSASGLNYTNFERNLIKWCPQFALNRSLEITITTTFANCNQLHYFNVWNIHKFSYRNDKIIESDFGHFVFLNTKSIMRKFLDPLTFKEYNYNVHTLIFCRKVG